MLKRAERLLLYVRSKKCYGKDVEKSREAAAVRSINLMLRMLKKAGRLLL